ncbi:hypothetical protein MHBO_002191, partial [Bonamia ostreae]
MKSKESVKFVAGGSTLNSVRVCQWVLGKSHKNGTSFIGCIGKDKNGQILKEYSEKDGVRTYFEEDETAPTGVCGVGILDKERTLFTRLAAANNFSVDFLDRKEVKKEYQLADVIYISGYFLTVSIESIILIAEHSSKNNKILAVNISAEFIAQIYKAELEKVLKYADFVFMNEQEAASYAKYVAGNNKLSLQEVAKKIATLPKVNQTERTVIITRGSQSTLVNCGGDIFANVKVDHIEEDKIVDVNGAGD